MPYKSLFEYSCPTCGRGMVRTTVVRNHKTKIKGYPFIVDEALIGICDVCGEHNFAPEERQRWEQLFAAQCEERHASLTPEEIHTLRHTLQLSQEDFARLIGATRPSVAAWERPERTVPPSRTADLLMKLVAQAVQTRDVPVLDILLDEAKKWNIVLELRLPHLVSSAPGPA